MNEPRSTRPSTVEPRLAALGAVLAGGASSRYGSPKALARVEGITLLQRAVDALLPVVTNAVVVGDRPELRGAVHLPARPDRRPGYGPLSGIDTALHWATELGLPGAMCVACDLPFLTPALVRAVIRRAMETGAAIVVPESYGPLGIEPLCAWYSVETSPEVGRALESGSRQIVSLVRAVGAYRIPLTELLPYGDPATLFMNVNTLDGRDAAEQIGSTGKGSRDRRTGGDC